MTSGEEVSLDKVRHFILEKQGLRNNKSENNILNIIKRIHNVQIDTISVVARSQDLILYNRLKNYKEKTIWDLQKNKKIFEYFSHALCLMPIEDYPLYAWTIYYRQNNPGNWTNNWLKENSSIVDRVYEYIKKNGATCSKDFKNATKVRREGWGETKGENLALKHLFHIGKLLISYRKGFQRYYDLTERVLPPSISSEPLDKEDLPQQLLKIIFSALGIASSTEFQYYMGKKFPKILWDGKKININNFLINSVKEGFLEQLSVSSLKDSYFILEDMYDQLISQSIKVEQDLPVKLLSPFDNITRDRYFPKKVWNFDYKFEAYVPKLKREFGFFCLPLLDNYDLIGFIDAKAHRKEKKLELISIYINKDMKGNFLYRLVKGLDNFAQFHNCSEIVVGNIYPKNLKEPLIEELKLLHS